MNTARRVVSFAQIHRPLARMLSAVRIGSAPEALADRNIAAITERLHRRGGNHGL